MPVEDWVKRLTEGAIGGSPVEIGKRYLHPEHGPIEITAGQYWGQHGLSNHWRWTVLETGQSESGYAGNWEEIMPEPEMVEVETPKCMHCGRKSKLQVPAEGVLAYQKGALMQTAFPNLTADEREMLISGTHPDCFDEMFPPDE